MKTARLDKVLSNLGYGSRKDVAAWAKQGRLTTADGRRVDKASDKVDPGEIRLDGEPLDPIQVLMMMNKPAGFTCSHRDRPPLVFELLPARFLHRDPAISCVGRLDKDTTGVLLLTDHGQLLHRLTAPTWKLPKAYQVATEGDVQDDQVARLSEGGWCLPDDDKPLAPAECRQTGQRSLELVLTEGRFHQVKRMLEAVGNPVVGLHRSRFAGLELGGLEPGAWRYLEPPERASLFAQCALTE